MMNLKLSLFWWTWSGKLLMLSVLCLPFYSYSKPTEEAPEVEEKCRYNVTWYSKDDCTPIVRLHKDCTFTVEYAPMQLQDSGTYRSEAYQDEYGLLRIQFYFRSNSGIKYFGDIYMKYMFDINFSIKHKAKDEVNLTLKDWPPC